MSLYDKIVIFNPFAPWISGKDYFIGQQVSNSGAFFQCNADNTSSGANEPPNVSFWDEIFPVDPNVNISDFVETVLDTEIGSGEVRSTSLRINADRGAFITDRNGGLTPIIDQFSKIQTTIVDSNSVTYQVIHEVDIIHPTQDGLQGTVLPIDLLGPEFYLQKTLFADQFFFKSMFDVSKGIIDFYNKNKGILQPRVTGADADSFSGGFNDLPVFTANDYTFNLSEIPHYDGLIQVMDRGGSSVAAQGAGDFFEVGFEASSSNFDEIKFRGFSSGNPSDQTSIPNIKSDNIVFNPAEQEGEIDATIGNVVGTWTDSSIGTLPRQNADFIGALEAWRLFPSHVSGATYPEDSIILVVNTLDSQGDTFHYKANKDTAISPPVPPTVSNADWDQHQFTDYLITEINYTLGSYSFWNDARANEWKSNGAKTAGTLQDDPPLDSSMKVWDSNQVKIDGELRQTWVDVRATDPAAIPTPFIRNSNVYRGFRVLVDGVGTGAFVGFDDDIIQWDGTQWLIFQLPATNNLVGVDEESRTYQFDTDTPGAWADVTTSIEQANDVYHAVYDITSTQGHNNKDNGGGGNFGQTAATTYEFRYQKSDSIFGFNSPTFYRQFAGVNFRVPFPFNSNNGNSIGSLYGDSDALVPATFEAENMGLTSSGFSGFNNLEAEDLGPFDALTFFINHEWRYNLNASGALVLAGNFSYRCALYDIDDTVVIQDFVVPFNNLWESVSLPIGGFKTYKARAAWAFGDGVQNIFLQELEVLNAFRWRNIKKIAIHWLGPYDDQGRYQPWGQLGFLFPSFIDPFVGLFITGFNIKLSIDSFQWSHPGLSISPPDTDRPLQPEFFYEPLITNKIQNDQANLAKLEITRFRHTEFEVTTVGFNDIRFGDSFFLENPKLVSFADRTTADLDAWVTATDYTANLNDVQDVSVGYRCILDHLSSGANQPPNATFWEVLDNPIPNTVKLVAKKIIRGIDKRPDGPGGFLRTLTGARKPLTGEV